MESLRSLQDDPDGVPDDDSVIRVVQPGQFQGDDMLSNAFEDYPAETAATFGLGGPCASVNLMSIWEVAGGEPADLLSGFDQGSRLAVLRVGDLRALTAANGDPNPHGVMLDPRDGRPWHAVMFALSGTRRSKGGKRAVREIATWLDV